MSSDKAILRRYEDNLNVGGVGVVILGARDIMKVIIQLLTEWRELFNIEVEEADKAVATIVITGVIVLFLLICFLIF